MFQNVVLIGNIFGTIGALIFIITSILKNKKQIVFIQSFAHFCLIISEAISNLFASIVQEIVCLIRNYTIIKNKNGKTINIILIIASFVFGVFVNIITKPEGSPWYGPLNGYLGVIATVQFSIVVLVSNSIIKIKISQGISGLLWGLNFLLATPSLVLTAIINFINCALSFIFIPFAIKKSK